MQPGASPLSNPRVSRHFVPRARRGTRALADRPPVAHQSCSARGLLGRAVVLGLGEAGRWRRVWTVGEAPSGLAAVQQYAALTANLLRASESVRTAGRVPRWKWAEQSPSNRNALTHHRDCTNPEIELAPNSKRSCSKAQGREAHRQEGQAGHSFTGTAERWPCVIPPSAWISLDKAWT